MIRDSIHTANRADRPKRMSRALMIGLVLGAEVLGIALIYQFFVVFECQQSDLFAACRFLRSLVARAMVIAAVMVVLVWLRPVPFRAFARRVQTHRAWPFLALHGGAGLLLLTPVPLLVSDGEPQSFAEPLVLFLLGGGLSLISGMLWLAPLAAWKALFRDVGLIMVIAMVVGFALPDLAEAVEPVWRSEILTLPTFAAVNALLQMTGKPVYLDPEAVVLGLETFRVNIATNCSGIEGLALVTVLAGLYAWLFRDEIRLGRYLATVLPVALAVSWAFNAVRIAVLVGVGEYLSPAVAIDGFHSYAGWLFFTLLSILLIGIVHRIDWLHKDRGEATVVPLRQSLVSASLIPFAVFMITLTLLSAFLPKPELGVPVIALTVGASLVVFLPALRRLEWRFDPLAFGLGLVIAGIWIFAAPEPDAGLRADMALLLSERPDAYYVWVSLRLIGTALCVPIAEELLFRGYLMSRIADWVPGSDGIKTLVAIVVTTTAFALMHQRWDVAAMSGVMFAFLALRKGRVSDAILAHITANAAIGIAAFIQFDWSLI